MSYSAFFFSSIAFWYYIEGYRFALFHCIVVSYEIFFCFVALHCIVLSWLFSCIAMDALKCIAFMLFVLIVFTLCILWSCMVFQWIAARLIWMACDRITQACSALVAPKCVVLYVWYLIGLGSFKLHCIVLYFCNAHSNLRKMYKAHTYLCYFFFPYHLVWYGVTLDILSFLPQFPRDNLLLLCHQEDTVASHT